MKSTSKPNDPPTLRPVVEADLPFLFEQQRDAEAHRMAAFTGRDADDEAGFLAHWRRLIADPAVIVRAIVAGGEVVGTIGSYVNEAGAREVTYWLGREHWGRGHATRALARFLESVERTRPLVGRCAEDNLASVAVLRKNGFVPTGRTRDFARARGEEVWEVSMVLE